MRSFSAHAFAACGLVLLLAIFAGCSSVDTRKVMDLAPFKRIFVVKRLVDDHHMDELLVAELKRLGHEAESGPLTMMPENTNALLTYEDRWEWDFSTHLVALSVELHTARTNKKLAEGRFYDPAPKARPPADVVHQVLAPLFPPK